MADIFDKFRLAGKVAVVTGGAGLLGAEFCRTLAQAGSQVIIADIHRLAAEHVEAALQRQNHKARAIEVDVRQQASVGAMISDVLSAYGQVDVLVNAAAMDPKFDPLHHEHADNAFEHYPVDVWKQAIEVNLTGMFLCCQAVAVPMLNQGYGSIINICSIYGLVGPDQRLYQSQGEPTQFKPVYYSVTKAAALGLTRYLATYFAGKNIRVNALTPGGVFDQHDARFVQSYSARAVMGRMANHDEMNGAVLFLASDASSYMTGANLVVDGGWTAW